MAKIPARKKRASHPGARHEELLDWLRGCVNRQKAKGELVDNYRVVRTSATIVTQWQSNAVTSFYASDQSDPDVAAALELGFDVVRRDEIGETMRADLGDSVFVLQMHHAPGGVGRGNVGVALHVGKTIFLYLLSSARANNLDAVTEDRRGNAVTEIISTTVREITSLSRRLDISYRPHVYAREHARIVRDESHGAALKSTLVAARALAYAPGLFDLTRSSDKTSFTFGTTMAAEAANMIIKGLNRGEVILQVQGGFYESVLQVPFTHEAMRIVETDRRTGKQLHSVDKHRLAVVEDVAKARQTMHSLVGVVLEDRWQGRRDEPATDWFAVGDLLAKFGLPSRSPEHRSKGIMVADLGPKGRARSARNLFSDRWVGAWRDGHITKLVRHKIDLELDGANIDAEKVYDEETGELLGYMCRIDVPKPDGGWGVSDEMWNEVLRRVHPTAENPRSWSGTVHPLVGVKDWSDSLWEYAIRTKNHTYVLYRRPVSLVRQDGSRPSWEDVPGEKVGGARAHELHKSVGKQMARALLAFESAPEPVRLTVRAAPSAAPPALNRGDVLAKLKADLADAECQRDGALDTVNREQGRHKRQQTAETEEDLDLAERAFERAKTEVRRLKAAIKATPSDDAEVEPEVDIETDVNIDTATPEFVAVALEKCHGQAPSWLHEANSLLLADLRFEVQEVIGGKTRIRWSADYKLRVATESGVTTLVKIPLSDTVLDHSHAPNGAVPKSGPENQAWSYFYKGRSFAEIGEVLDIDGSRKKNSGLYKGLGTWLSDGGVAAVPDSDMRAAALDCPILEVRRVIWSMVTGRWNDCLGIDERFVAHIKAVFSSPAPMPRWGWCRETHDLARRAADLLLERGGDAPIGWLAGQLDVTEGELLPLTRVNGTARRDKAAGGKYPPKRAISPFTKNWARGASHLGSDEKLLALRPCPHADCPERLAGGTPFASHILAVPETEDGHGVLCPSCRRMPIPGKAAVRFPKAYLRPWRGLLGPKARVRGPREHLGTHLDPSRPDPGPGADLPDAGSLPRPETRKTGGGGDMKKKLQHLPLQGDRVLILGLSKDEEAAVAQLVRRLGGQVAVKLNALTPYVVIPRPGWRGDVRVDRAKESGAQIMEVNEFRRLGVEISKPAGTKRPAA